MCPRCAADPRPTGFGDDRKCAFDAAGDFTPENWNCATLEALMDVQPPLYRTVSGNDESLQTCYRRSCEFGGWIVLTRYKRRGCTSSAVYVGDFWPPQSVTLALVEEFLA